MEIFNYLLSKKGKPRNVSDDLFSYLLGKNAGGGEIDIYGEGTTITLNGTANAPMRITLNPTAISQNTYTGKNLYNPNTQEQGGFNYRTGENYEHSSSIRNIIYNIEPNTQYTISCNESIGEVAVCFFDSNGTSLVGTATSSSSVADKYWSFTTKANTSYIKIRIGSTAYPKTTSGTYDIQLEKGSTATSYEPYVGGTASPNPSYPQDIHIISGSNSIVVSDGNGVSQTAPINLGEYELGTIGNYSNEFVRSGGEQLFDISAIEESKYINSGAGTTGTSSVSNLSDYIEVESGEKYTLTYNYSSLQNSNGRGLCYFDSSKTYISGFPYDPTTKTYSLSIPSNAKYVRFSYDKNCYEIMLNKGTTALPYVPYEKGWYYKQGIGKATLNGGSSENWIKGSTSNNYSYFYTSTYDNLIGNNYDGMCNVFNILKSIMTASTSVTTDTISIGGSEYSKIRVKILTSRLSKDTTNAYLTWLSTNLPLVYYQMATPTYTKITGTLESQLENIYKNMLSYKGTTNISQVNNDLPFELKVVAKGKR